MRAEASNASLQVKAIAGTHVVLMAIKAAPSLFDDLRGFAISKSTNGAAPFWLKGIKYFDGTVQNPTKGQEFPSNEQPVQSFFWSDYAATPGTPYEFTVVPRLGTPGHLTDGDALTLTITTEPEDDGRHGVWFNRGIVASHKMSQAFQNKQLTADMVNDVDGQGRLRNAEVAWLSRGLAEACLAYINGAKAGEGLRVCAYEFTWAPILDALKRANNRGVDVRIIYHGVPANDTAVRDAQLPIGILSRRTKTPTPHNKYIVKLSGGKPRAVWTGSTNFTDTGLFGQTNVGHVVTDDAVAAVYLEYWNSLKDDPTHKPALANSMRLTPNPPNVLPKNSVTEFYSPRIFDNMLDWYGQRVTDAVSLAMMTIPFNVATQILAALDGAKRSLRLVVLENEPTPEVRAAEKRNKGMLAFSNGAILGKTVYHNPKGGLSVAPVANSNLEQWFVDEELARPLNDGHVYFVHSKILLIDPLSDDPLICTGSANFSKNSLVSNDENMLLIRGSSRVADIYLTEIDRIFKHFYDRNAINRSAAAGEKTDWLYLDTTRGWIDRNLVKGSYKLNRLNTFFPDAASADTWIAHATSDPNPFTDEAARADAARKAANDRARTRKTATTSVATGSGSGATTRRKTPPAKQAPKKNAARPSHRASIRAKSVSRKTTGKASIAGKAKAPAEARAGARKPTRRRAVTERTSAPTRKTRTRAKSAPHRNR